MSVRIAQASRGESGYTYQQAGNQTGSELNVKAWYSRPWDVVIRAKDPAIAEKIARFMEAAAANRNVGYDQANRMTLYNALQKVGMDPAKIATPCECDCSSLVSAAIIAAGIQVPSTMWTGSMETNLVATGQFYTLREGIYTGLDIYLQRGDILLNTKSHVAIALDNGSKVTASKSVSYAATVNVSAGGYLSIRTSPEVRTDNLYEIDGQIQRLKRGTVVAIIEERSGWGRLADINAWISLAYVKKG